MNFTAIIPTRNRPEWVNESAKWILIATNYNIIIIDDNSDIECEYIEDPRITLIRNPHKSCLSLLWNQGVAASETDYILIMSHKVLAVHDRYYKSMEELLSKNYAMVATNGFHFFGFHKHLFNIIGGFDEGFQSGGWEDEDFQNRLFEHNLGWYQELRGVPEPHTNRSDWDYHKNKMRYDEKWRKRVAADQTRTLIRISGDICNTDFSSFADKYNDIKFLPFDQSCFHWPKGGWPHTKFLNEVTGTTTSDNK
jgi:glycosyltransferase involved in cell wall biosynthesis